MNEPLRAEQEYQIYDLLPPGTVVLDPYEAPWAINYTTDLQVRLHPRRTFSLGEMTEVVFYLNFDGNNYSDPIIRETYVYNRDPVSKLAISRSQTVEWYLKDGSIGPHPKQRGPKYYTTLAEKRNEVQTKRRNQTSAASEVIIGALVQGGMSFNQAISEGQTYWATLTQEVIGFEEGNTTPLRDRLENDTNPTWLPAVKDYALAELA